MKAGSPVNYTSLFRSHNAFAQTSLSSISSFKEINDNLLYATQYINATGLEEHQNKRVDDLSGGT